MRLFEISEVDFSLTGYRLKELSKRDAFSMKHVKGRESHLEWLTGARLHGFAFAKGPRKHLVNQRRKPRDKSHNELRKLTAENFNDLKNRGEGYPAP